MSAPTVYSSQDANAPTLSGTAGDLINLLDKCLVTGYTGKAAAGWVRKTAFTGNSTTQAVFQQGAGNAFFLDVDDRGATSVLTGASGREAAVRGYEAMTDVSTGTNPFPTVAQVAAATANWRKSVSADAVTRGWILIADDRTFTLCVLDGDAANVWKVYYFGDVYSIKSGDSYRTGITVRTVVNSATNTGALGTSVVSGLTNASTGFYLARIAAGTGTSFNGGLLSMGAQNESAASFTAWNDSLIYVCPLLVTDANTVPGLRGRLRGAHFLLNYVGLNDGDTFSGTGDYAGRTFLIVRDFRGGGGGSSGLVLETSAWDTSS